MIGGFWGGQLACRDSLKLEDRYRYKYRFACDADKLKSLSHVFHD